MIVVLGCMMVLQDGSFGYINFLIVIIVAIPAVGVLTDLGALASAPC